MLKKQKYPLYRYCLFQTLGKHKDQLISIIGKVTSINSQSQTLTLQVAPAKQKPDAKQAQSIKVIVPKFTVNYLLNQNALKNIMDSQDLEQAEKFINKKKNVERLVVMTQNMEDNTYTSLKWFVVKQNNPQVNPKATEESEQKNGISATSLISTITAEEFRVNQYIQVRGKCIDEFTVQMQQFTDFEENYDLSSHNYALALGLQYCKKIL